MSRFALAAGIAALALAAAGCNSGGGHPAAVSTAGTPARSAPCTLDKAQRRTIARSLADIRRLRRIQGPLQRSRSREAPNENTVTGKFLLDLGATKLPLDVRSHPDPPCEDSRQSLRCLHARPGSEPFLGNRVKNRCG